MADVDSDDDIFIWPDQFWCLRGEFTPAFLRSPDFRVVKNLTVEWTALNSVGMQSTLGATVDVM